ncbi:biotin--[acetyl-CoA-carboxylase] ligase [Thermanaerosceptrum fracticalcis]|uniref:Bifunctional ligase/repressor BirA n=1 Tax=Thermanaerosceptrum fracticalcis TaxID=1712410 RepID=A0A7G6E1M7_THEFR|nr:biotin--[acetyl-CoA-carboxylase] ligase [Thermanaerosceptrum fracticalcis]QNB45981.1 biotin--[acetyl-CoA-carboxylase] ligase [Thermanaerosceptrum fracticalcis]
MKQAILQMLIENQGEYVSGEQISKTLHVTRTAIWKQIKNLKQEGYEIDSSPRLGYRLLSRPDILKPEEIKIGLATEILGRELYVFEQVNSTNDLAKKKAAEGASHGTVVVADQQLSGRGRLGRPWASPPGTGLWFSVVLRPPLKPFLAPQLIFVSAVAVCHAIRDYTGLPVTIKWPNDILFSGKKVCGILTELSAEIDIINYVVIGIGINVNQEMADFPPELQEKAISLAVAGNTKYNRVGLLKAILKELEKEYEIYLTEGFPAVLKHWRSLTSTLGQEVMVSSTDETFTGVAEDINGEGCLLVRTEDGNVRSVMVGDVSLRGKEGHYL